ncbi:heterogeneous nuclear ribonucleoprotein 87F-like isoform X2 [Uranotaenia lowii]|uniref:heterogeneous nuclear ribonucleoprotein 87F-like isoform X2 n=1 Tax=Uranotaenia lowii TaxID=190385 RepID=UPI00247A1D6A|nr:heterogeneous nuclear ribonucleoprotein 87F-like isoform X2 [Uranotaenia lowii]
MFKFIVLFAVIAVAFSAPADSKPAQGGAMSETSWGGAWGNPAAHQNNPWGANRWNQWNNPQSDPRWGNRWGAGGYGDQWGSRWGAGSGAGWGQWNRHGAAPGGAGWAGAGGHRGWNQW